MEPASPVAPAFSLPPSDKSSYKDRGLGLIVFGIMQIGLGAMTFLMSMFLLAALLVSGTHANHTHHHQYLLAFAIYAPAGIGFVVLGIGSIRARRWARALTLVSSWYGLIVGILVTVLMTAMLPVIMRTAIQRQPNAAVSPSSSASLGLIAVIVTVIIVLLALFLVALPIAFIAFYRRADVEQTCRHRDPVECWTDSVPLPVLAVSMICATGCVYFALMSFTSPMFPFFGLYLTGLKGSAGMLSLAALDAYLAIGLYRLKTTAWWVAMIALIGRTTSLVLTLLHGNFVEAYSKMGWSDSQLQQLNTNPILRSHVILWWGLISMMTLFGYTLWLKRYFIKPPSHTVAHQPSLLSD